MKDEGEGVSRFEMGKIDIAGLMNNDGSLEVQVKLKSISLDDIRECSNLAEKRYNKGHTGDTSWSFLKEIQHLHDMKNLYCS